MSVRIDTKSAEAVCVVHLQGEVDIALVPEVRRALDSTISGGCRNMVLDLAEVTYADSSALGLLVWIDHKLAPSGGKLVLVGANRDVTRVLELSGLVGVAPSIGEPRRVSSALEGLELRTEEPPSAVGAHDDAARRIEELSTARAGGRRGSSSRWSLPRGGALRHQGRGGRGARERHAPRLAARGGRRGRRRRRRLRRPRRGRRSRTPAAASTGDASCTDDVYAPADAASCSCGRSWTASSSTLGDEGGTTVTLVKHLRQPECAPLR